MKLKAILLTVFVAAFAALAYQPAEAQIFDRIKREVKNRTENKVVNKAGNATDKALDKVDQSATDAVKGGEKANKTTSAPNTTEVATNDPAPQAKQTQSSYANYDFVPGDKIIFQPDLSREPDAELPARFTVTIGNAEIQTEDGEKVVRLGNTGRVKIFPMMDSQKYLPEQYTVEFDFMYEETSSSFYTLGLELRNETDNISNTAPHALTIYNKDRFEWGDSKAARDLLPKNLIASMKTPGKWHHMAIYVRKNLGKAYIDEYRVAASNNLPQISGFVTISTYGGTGVKIKNFRLAAGGDDKYNKIVTDGKFITHGIQFDVNNSSIKDESMGALNEIVKLMKEHNDLKFEINGHTDSDGKADANMKLSQDRADAVKARLIAMGISPDRLTTKGNGATKPIDSNSTQEGKANNRRVEFVKI